MLTRSLPWLVFCAGILHLPATAAESNAQAGPELSGWIRLVLQQHPAIQAAGAQLNAARGRARGAARPLFNPELEFDYESSEIDTTYGGISQTIDWSDKRGARTGLADAELDAAAAELQAARQQLAIDLLLALADWHTAAAIAGLGEKQSALMARFSGLAERRREAGDLDQTELDLAHLAMAQAVFGQANANEALIRARQRVVELAGIENAAWPDLDTGLTGVDTGQLDVDGLLDNLPVMRVAMARVAAARAAVQVSLRDKRPDPTVAVRVGKEDTDTLTGITLSVPLFIRNTRSEAVNVARAGLVQAEREAAAHRQQARAALIAAAQIYGNARRAWQKWLATGEPRLGLQAGLLDRLWQAGELNTTDYLVQLKQVLDTEVSVIEQRGRLWRAWAEWLAASGLAGQWLDLEGAGQ